MQCRRIFMKMKGGADSEVSATTNKLRCIKTKEMPNFIQRVDGRGDWAIEKMSPSNVRINEHKMLKKIVIRVFLVSLQARKVNILVIQVHASISLTSLSD